jgi:2-hydroxy-6-oxonona-2,4-dienedioate hydrolase
MTAVVQTATEHPMGSAQYVDVDGVRTRYFDAGEGHALVLVHGGDFRSLSSADDWSTNAPALAEHFRVLSVDKVGQGFTDLPTSDAGYTMRASGEHLSGFITELGLTEVTLVGHSRGALPVAWLALERPDLVRSLVIFNSNTLAAEHPATPKDFYPNAYRNRPEQPDAEYVMREPIANSYSGDHVDADFVARRLEIAQLPKTAEALRIMGRLYESLFVPDFERLRSEVLRRIDGGELTCPVSLIWGRNDVSAPLVIGDELAAQMARHTPVLDYHVFNRSGHYTYREHPDECNAVVVDFVRRAIHQ